MGCSGKLGLLILQVYLLLVIKHYKLVTLSWRVSCFKNLSVLMYPIILSLICDSLLWTVLENWRANSWKGSVEWTARAWLWTRLVAQLLVALIHRGSPIVFAIATLQEISIPCILVVIYVDPLWIYNGPRRLLIKNYSISSCFAPLWGCFAFWILTSIRLVILRVLLTSTEDAFIYFLSIYVVDILLLLYLLIASDFRVRESAFVAIGLQI